MTIRNGRRSEPAITVGPGARGVFQGVLIERENRFRARVRCGDRVLLAHVPNPGRMHELMTSGRPLQLVAQLREGRKTAADVVAVRYDGRWICIDNRLGGKLARLALEAHAIPGLEPYQRVEAEVVCGSSRLDFRLVSDDAPSCWVEVKSCTLVVGGRGRFPDAPTVRGRRHVIEQAERVAGGERAAVLFVVQRPDAVAVSPNDDTDPAFGEALRAAASAGVVCLAVTSRWRDGRLELGVEIPVRLT